MSGVWGPCCCFFVCWVLMESCRERVLKAKCLWMNFAVSEWATCLRNKSSSPSPSTMKVHHPLPPPILQAFIKAGKGGGINSIPKRNSDENLTSFDFDAFQRKSVSWDLRDFFFKILWSTKLYKSRAKQIFKSSFYFKLSDFPEPLRYQYVHHEYLRRRKRKSKPSPTARPKEYS